jgi:hypothetical protein
MSIEASATYRLKVRVGESEFEAEGPEETVKSQFVMFLSALNATSASHGSASDAGKGSDGGRRAAPENDDLLGNAMWGRFYKQEDDGGVSLKVLPNTENVNADALVLLLYGFLMLRKQDTVGSTDLLAMAKKSGLRIDRIDRNIPATYSRYINRGGTRKGCRYSLNNQGQIFGQQLLEAEAER